MARTIRAPDSSARRMNLTVTQPETLSEILGHLGAEASSAREHSDLTAKSLRASELRLNGGFDPEYTAS